MEDKVSAKLQKLKGYIKNRHHIKGSDDQGESCPVTNSWAAFDIHSSSSSSDDDNEESSELMETTNFSQMQKRGFVDGVKEFLEIVGATIFWVVIVPLSFLFEYIVLVVSVILTINIVALFG